MSKTSISSDMLMKSLSRILDWFIELVCNWLLIKLKRYFESMQSLVLKWSLQQKAPCAAAQGAL